ncbi:Squalene monooxygenase [Citrus sinensis]|uniref:Squalene monooxygenase n=1 Tax=Citrus sinensis TaxID=2711 RepID=A0ACB8P5V8_CITSI|nr:Squalene monooxygenase [Citrus sinensis]
MVLMIDQFIGTSFATSLIGLLLLIILRPNKMKKLPKSRKNYNKMGNDVVLTSADNEHSLPENVSGPDVIIVGAGVAGAALAHALGKDGRRVHVIERDLTEPDRIVGELLQPGGYLKLVELGLDDCVEEIDAQPVVGYALFKDGKITKTPYPLGNFQANVAGRSFHNGRFIQRMREKAASLSNVRMEEGTVTSLFQENGIVKGVHYKTKDGQEHKSCAPLTIVFDGGFSNLRRSLCNPKVDIPSCFVGMALENCQLPVPNHGHVVLADPSPILFYPISSSEVRCLVDVPAGQKLPSIANGEMAKYLKTKVAPQIPDELRDAFISKVEKGSIRTATNRSMPAAPKPTPGALLLGDAFNMRHPLTGGGMTVALSDVVVLRNLIKPLQDFHDAASLNQYLESFYTLRKVTVKLSHCLSNISVCIDNEENGNFVPFDNIIPSEENINWPFMSTTNPQHKDIDLDQSPKFDEYLDIVGREEVIVHPSFDLVEEREIVVDTISYCSLDLPKEDKKSCDIFQQLVDYEKKSFFLNYVEVRHEQYEKTLLEKLLIEEFVLRHWSDWMDPVASTINTLANSAYQVFSSSSDEAREIMRQASVDYLGLWRNLHIRSNGSTVRPKPSPIKLNFPFLSNGNIWCWSFVITISFA